MPTRIAVLGTGRMGSALVRRLAAAGFDLTLSQARCEFFDDDIGAMVRLYRRSPRQGGS